MQVKHNGETWTLYYFEQIDNERTGEYGCKVQFAAKDECGQHKDTQPARGWFVHRPGSDYSCSLDKAVAHLGNNAGPRLYEQMPLPGQPSKTIDNVNKPNASGAVAWTHRLMEACRQSPQLYSLV